MTRLYLIRHAQAEGNLYRRLNGWYDGHVTPLGRQQIAALRERFSGERIDAVYASDLSRTRATAQAVAAPRDLPIRTDSGLREAHLGVYCNMPAGELLHSDSALYRNFLDFSPRWAPEEGESFLQLARRMTQAVSRIVAAHPGQSVAVFSHSMAIRCFQAALRGLHPSQLKGLLPSGDNTAVSCYRVDEGGFHIEFENDASHLPPQLSTLALRQKAGRGGEAPVVWFRDMDPERESNLYNAARRDAWIGVHGSLLGFDGDGFLAEAREARDWDPRSVQRAMWENAGVGILQLSPLHGARSGVGHISFLYVDPSFRGRGIGLQLTGQAVGVYRSMGRKCLRLHCAPNNAPAQKLYRCCGFVKVGQVPGSAGPVDLLELPL